MKYMVGLFFLLLFSFNLFCNTNINLVSSKEQVTNGEEFYINIILSSDIEFTSISFKLLYDNTRFLFLDNNPDIPGNNLAIGDIFGTQYMLNSNQGENGEVIFSIQDTGVGIIGENPVIIAIAKFKCTSQIINPAKFTLTNIDFNGELRSNVNLTIYVGRESITTIGYDGGVVTSNDITITFPEAATFSDTSISISEINEENVPVQFPDNPSLNPVKFFKFTPSMMLRKPATIEIDVSSISDNSKLKLYYLDEEKGTWLRIGGYVNSNTLTATIIHFSYYALVSDRFYGDFITIKRLGAYPNPFSPNNNGKNDTTYITFYISKDIYGIGLKIYDVNGNLIRTLLDDPKTKWLTGEYHIEWDGTDNYGFTVNTGIYIIKLGVREYYDRDNFDEKKATVVVSRNMLDE